MTNIPQAKRPWETLGYEQVPGLANRIIARYLRTQRKTMRRFFADHRLTDLALRMDQIRKSSKGMLAKNRMFQEVLDAYSKMVIAPDPAPAGSVSDARAAPQPDAEATDQQDAGAAGVDLPGDRLPDGVGNVADPVRQGREDSDGGVPAVAGVDGAEPVVEE